MASVETKATLEIRGVRYKEDFKYAVKLTKLLLTPIALWPENKSKLYKILVQPIAITFCFSILIFMSVPVGLFLIYKVSTTKLCLKLIGPLSFSLLNFFKYGLILSRKRKLAECLNLMSENWRIINHNVDREIMLKKAKSGRMWTLICLALMYSAGVPFAVILPLSKGAKTIGNISYRSLPYPSYFFYFDPNVRPIYDYIFTLQCIGAFVRYTLTCGINSFIIICVMHIAGYIDVTTRDLNNLSHNPDTNWIKKLMKNNVQILNFAELVESIFKEVFLFDLFGYTMSICTTAFSFFMEYENRETASSVSFVILLTSFIFNIFIQCYIGEILTSKCESIGEVAYTINWYEFPVKDARNIIMLISRSQRPVILTAGKMAQLSIQTFSSIVKAAAGYVNLMRTVS